MLKVNDVYAGYDGIQIVRGVSIEVPDHQVIAIVGANGVGKTTLLKAITGQIPLMSGEVQFDQKSINGLPSHIISDEGISLVPEGRQLFGNMTVEENLDVGSCSRKNRKNRQQNKEKVYALFPALKERRKQLTGTLSGGEQQMVATARALMGNPKLLIMDEPSWGLAPLLVEEMFQTIESVRDGGASVLLVEQNVYKTLQIADWGYVIEYGVIAMEGEGKKLLEDEGLRKAYLGI
jgi:branched-chain amino acid transport system ATP-binding protein